MDTARHNVKNVGNVLKYTALGLCVWSCGGRLALMALVLWKVILHPPPFELPLDAAIAGRVDYVIDHSGFVVLFILRHYQLCAAFLIVYACWKFVPLISFKINPQLGMSDDAAKHGILQRDAWAKGNQGKGLVVTVSGHGYDSSDSIILKIDNTTPKAAAFSAPEGALFIPADRHHQNLVLKSAIERVVPENAQGFEIKAHGYCGNLELACPRGDYKTTGYRLDLDLSSQGAVWRVTDNYRKPRTGFDGFEQTQRASFDATWIGERINTTCEQLDRKLDDALKNFECDGLLKWIMLYLLFLVHPLLGAPALVAYATLRVYYLMDQLGEHSEAINLAVEGIGLLILLYLSPYIVGFLTLSGVLLKVAWSQHVVPYMRQQKSRLREPILVVD
mmetsp:Transcript_118859/g.296475  ORF Transcript_118859/g.296475 Transcript_118859/m.296475 type:complete len:390 (-) Transcript_118859:221-1390(-)